MRTILAVFLVFVCTLELLFAQTNGGTDVVSNSVSGSPGWLGNLPLPLVVVEIIYIIIVLAAGFLCRFLGKEDSAKLKGMNLPEGTIRSMLALIIVGSFVIFLVLGSGLKEFNNVVTAFGTLAGAVLGFYFAHRGAQHSTAQNVAPSEQNGTPETPGV